MRGQVVMLDEDRSGLLLLLVNYPMGWHNLVNNRLNGGLS